MNSWHSWSPNSKWLVFSSKVNSAYTQLFLTHINEEGNSSPPVLLSQFTASDRAANIPEFVNLDPNEIKKISVHFIDDFSYLRAALECVRVDDYRNAEIACRKALQINPDNLDAQLEMALVLESLGRLHEAITPCREAIRIDSKNANAHSQLGSLLWQCGNQSEGMVHLTEGVRLDPASPGSHLKLGQALFDQRKKDEALMHLNKAASLRPNYKTHRSIADILAKYGQVDLAIDHYLKTLQLEPNDTHSLNNLAITLLKRGKADQAAVFYRRALKNSPNALPSLIGLATLLITADDPKLGDAEEAIRLCAKACELTHHQEPESLNLLSSAYAKAGNFQEAIQAANKALGLANSSGKIKLAMNIQKRIELYRMGKSAEHGSPIRSMTGL
jgi:tetratricopeptide (TPR) repeat protein